MIEDDIQTIKMVVRSILEHQAIMEMKLNQLINDSQPKDRQDKEKAIKDTMPTEMG
jgi:hypothetical protein